MVKILIENNSDIEKCIEIIKCPTHDCSYELGDGKYDKLDIPAWDSITIESACQEICWRYCAGNGTFKKSNTRVIQV